MRIKKESTKILKKFILPEGMEIEAGKFILEKGDKIYFEISLKEKDGRKNNIKNFGNKKAEPFDKEDGEKKKKDDKKEQTEEDEEEEEKIEDEKEIEKEKEEEEDEEEKKEKTEENKNSALDKALKEGWK